MYDLVIIGAGLTGLVAAYTAARAGWQNDIAVARAGGGRAAAGAGGAQPPRLQRERARSGALRTDEDGQSMKRWAVLALLVAGSLLFERKDL